MRTNASIELSDKNEMRHVSAPGCGRGDLARRLAGLLLVLFGLRSIAIAQEVSGPVQVRSEASVQRPVITETGGFIGRSHAAANFLHGRTAVGGAAPAQSMADARAEHAAMVRAQSVQPKLSSLNAAWQPVGPGPVASLAFGKISGRVSSIAIDPADASGNTVFVGTTGGGVWKSINAAGPAGSVVFSPLTDNLPVFSGNAGSSTTVSLSIGAISAQVGGIVLAGTGDPNDSADSYYGGGILRSTDGGLTWTVVPGSQDGVAGAHSFTGLGFAGFAWSTAAPGTVVAAVSQSLEGAVVNATTSSSVMGLYVSSDSGATWRMATVLDGTQVVQGPAAVAAGGPAQAATAVVWNPLRQRFYAAIRFHGYYESIDGLSWTRLANQPGTGMNLTACPTYGGSGATSVCPVFRGALTVQPSSGDTFALTTDRNNMDQGLWQDVCGLAGGRCSSAVANFGTRLASSALEAGGGSTTIPQADYNMALAAVPSAGDTLLFVGTGDLYRCSLAAGCVLRNTTNATNACAAPAQVAPAQHAIATLSTASLLFLGNDSGLWRSTDNVLEQGAPCSADDATHFQNLNAGFGSLAEIISFAQDPEDPANVLMGLGASGTVSLSGTAPTAWAQVSAAEGGTVAIDQADPRLWYISNGGGVSLRSCSLGARCGAADFAGPPTIGATETNADASLLDAPWILDPGLSANVIIGTCRVWRGPVGTGASWPGANQLSTTLGGPQNRACDPATNPAIRSLAAGGAAITGATPQNSGSRVLYAGMAGLLDGGGAFAGRVFTTRTADVATSSTRWLDLSLSSVSNDLVNAGKFNPVGFDISSIVADAHDATGATVYAALMGFSQNGASSPHLYGSKDGGAHWQNISSNLPNAPVNAIVVDPNDGNTVYVASDTGVYVTTQVTNCVTANCWSVYGTALPNAPVVQLSAAAPMPTGDGRMGMLRAGTYGRGLWEIPLLTAATSATPSIALSPTSLVFANQAVGTASAAQNMEVTNTGNAPLLVSRTVTTGDFALVDHCSGTTVAVNASCSIAVQFLPTAQAARTGVLTIYGNVSGGQATAALSGTGTAPGSVILTPLALSFPTTPINATSAARDLTISNLGGAAVTIGAPTITGDFRVSANTCGTSLAPSIGCTISVVFVPTAAGTRSGGVTIAASSGVVAASLTGVATTPATDSLSPASLSFGSQQLGTSSTTQQVTLTNAGDVPLTLISARISAGDFTAVNGCGNSLNAHSTCSIDVAYVPKSIGAGSGVLLVSDQFRTQSVNLNGIGVAPPGVSLSPSGSLSFAATAVGAHSSVLSLTLTNNGGVPLTLQNFSLTGDFVLVSGGSCGTTVNPAAACTLQVAFAPTAAGIRTGSLVLTDTAPTSPQTVTFTGTGIDFSLAADGNTSATVASGKSAAYPVLLSSVPGVAGTATLACTGAPVNATCMVSPGTAALGTTTLVTVTVATGVNSSVAQDQRRPLGSRELPPLLLAGLLPVGALLLRRRRMGMVTGLLAIVCIVAGGGCGAGRQIPAAGEPIPVPIATTPPGNYSLSVTATSSGLTRTMSLSLTVQ